MSTATKLILILLVFIALFVVSHILLGILEPAFHLGSYRETMSGIIAGASILLFYIFVKMKG
ncbi:MAG: hypothetical protein ACD_22C00003G0003 [uncultured bacterium]|nr:MAG: hypothetical protein ACD_22C00003G0003 [uncultured bacterium]